MFQFHWELKASVYFTLLSTVSRSLVLLDKRREGETHKLTPDWAGWTNMLKKISSGPKRVSGNDTVETLFFPFLDWSKRATGSERVTKQCMPFQGERELCGVGWKGVEGHISSCWRCFVSFYTAHSGDISIRVGWRWWGRGGEDRVGVRGVGIN